MPPLVLLPSIGQFYYAPGSSFSDLAISHYPNALFLLNAIKTGQGFPWWSPSILSGYPFAADPLSGLWYPPGLLALLLPLPAGFNLIVFVHMVFSGIGTFVWLRSRGLKSWAALAGGLAFEGLPKLVAHFAAGHLTLFYAAAWTPWLLLAEDTWQRKGGWRALWRSPGVVFGIIILAVLSLLGQPLVNSVVRMGESDADRCQRQDHQAGGREPEFVPTFRTHQLCHAPTIS